MSRSNENDISLTTVLVLLTLFLVVAAIGVATVLLPEVRNDASPSADAGVETP